MASDTLLIRHLPVSLSSAEVEDLLHHIGAIQVAVHESKIKKHSIAFAKFVPNFNITLFNITFYNIQFLFQVQNQRCSTRSVNANASERSPR